VQGSHSATETRLEIQKLNTLPPISLVAQELLAAISDSDLDLRHIASIIEQDPALLARIIGLANSAYFGYPERVTTAEDAIFKVLGLNTARNLALSMVLSGPFNTAQCPAFRLDEYWTTAMVTAALAQRLARHVTAEPRPHGGDAYLAGLLHSLGLLALVHLYPADMAGVFNPVKADAELPLAAREVRLLGADHLQVGGWLARKWHLPAFVVAVIENFDQTGYRGQHFPLVQLIGFCVRWAGARQDVGATVSLDELTVLGIAAADAEQALSETLRRREEIVALAKILAID